MKNTIYRLVEPGTIQAFEETLRVEDDDVVVRPTHMSICHADQRYYQGDRSPEVLEKKLPMALIHEAIGIVIDDPKGMYRSGTVVAMVPNTPCEEDTLICENYLRTSRFRASGYDGFMQDNVTIRRDRLVPLPEGYDADVSAFVEICSVAWHIIDRFSKLADDRRDYLGVWGEGNMGYIISLFLKYRFPDSKIFVFGVIDEKLQEFDFVDRIINVRKIPSDIYIDHGFECVGSAASGTAINQIINSVIRPQGTISLAGVSEEYVPLNTRMVLEKGLTLFGSSRSGKDDFVKVIDFIDKNDNVRRRLRTLVGRVVEVGSVEDIHKAFSEDLSNPGRKTILHWNIHNK